MTSVANDLALALELADAADALTLDRFGALDLRVETKPDLTPVTDADRSAEELLRSSLTAHRPDDSVFGEELGGTPAFTGRQWVLDPIDGTKNFVRGVPVWCNVDRSTRRRHPRRRRGQRTCARTPVVGRRGRGRVHLVRRRGSGASLSPVSTTSPRRACRSPTSPPAGMGQRARFIELTDAVWRVRAYGDFWSYCLVAEGAVDIAAEPEVKPWDLAPLDILVREAGGSFTNFQGQPGTPRRQRRRDQRPAPRCGAGQAERDVNELTFLFYLTPE